MKMDTPSPPLQQKLERIDHLFLHNARSPGMALGQHFRREFTAVELLQALRAYDDRGKEVAQQIKGGAFDKIGLRLLKDSLDAAFVEASLAFIHLRKGEGIAGPVAEREYLNALKDMGISRSR